MAATKPQSQARELNGGAPLETVMPRCSGCGTSPAPITTSFLMQAGARLAVFHCAVPECGQVHGVQVVGVQPPPSRLVVPAS